MIRIRPNRCALFAATLFSVCLAASDAMSQTVLRRNVWRGTDALRYLLSSAELQVVPDMAALRADPAHTILIVLGDQTWLDRAPGMDVERFLRRGGGLLSASNAKASALVKLSSVLITGNGIVDDQHVERCLQRHRTMPFVVPDTISLPDGSESPFADLRVATNVPSYLGVLGSLPEGMVPLASFPPGVAIESNTNPPTMLDRRNEKVLFAVGGNIGGGRCLIMADDGVFMNDMILEAECENLAFAQKCLDWLIDVKGARRTRAMFVEHGKPHNSFEVQLKEVPQPSPLKILEQMLIHRDEIADQIQTRLARSERTDSINEGVILSLDESGGIGLPRVRRFTLWCIAAGVIFYTVYRLSNEGRYFVETRLPLLATAVAAQMPAGSLAEQRQRAQVASGNLWDSASQLARQRFAAFDSGEDRALPKLAFHGSLWRRWPAARRARRLWNIAHGKPTVRIPPARWDRFLADLDAFDRDVTDGTVKLPGV